MTGTYYEQIAVKTYLSLTDTTYNAVLDEFGKTADQMVENLLAPYTTFPITGSDKTKDISSLANYWVCAKFFKHIHQPETEKLWIENYTELLNAIITRLQTSDTSNKLLQYTTPYRSSPLADE